MGVLIGRICCGPFHSLSYLLTGDEGRAILIDAGPPLDNLPRLLDDLNADLELVLITHTHYDHLMNVSKIVKLTGARALAHPADIEMMGKYWLEHLGRPPDLEPLTSSEIIVGDIEIEVLHTPGHTPGSVCYLLKGLKVLFTGDTLFSGGVGRTDLPGGDSEMLRQSLRKIFELEDEVLVLPGHGSETTIGNERKNLEEMLGMQ